MKKSPVAVFSTWATNGKDKGMERNHKAAVENMLTFATEEHAHFSFIDAGCGNGWVVRQVQQLPGCSSAVGVDGAAPMITKANHLDPKGNYFCEDLMAWTPKEKVSLVHSMEVVYYFKAPDALLQHIYTHWLLPEGRLIVGLDFYLENPSSHDWPESCGIDTMQLFSENQWTQFFEQAGFQGVQSWRVGAKEGWSGTLVVTGTV